MRYLTDEEYKSGNFIDTKSAYTLLNFNKDNFLASVKVLNLEKFQYRVGKTLYTLYTKKAIENIQKLIHEYINTYTTLKIAEGKLQKQEYNALERFDIPVYVKTKDSIFSKQRQSVKIEDLNKFLNNIPDDTFKRIKITDESIIKNNYYTLQEISDLLGITINNARTLVSENKTPRAVYKNKVYYSKVNIDILKNEQLNNIDKYLSQKEAINKGFEIDVVNKTKPYAIPRHFRTERFDYGKIKNMYLIDDLEITKNSRFSANPLFGNIHKDPNIMFLNRLEVYTIMNDGIDLETFKKEAPFTVGIWLHHVNMIFSKSRSSSNILDRNTREYVYLTKDILNMVSPKGKIEEIYNIETAELVLFLNGCNSRKRERLVRFLNFTYQKIRLELENNSINKQVYDIERINELFIKKKKAKLLVADTYDAEQFLMILDYCMDVKNHTQNSINEIKNSNTAKYASSWLYSLIHMNNGWRAGDVINFKAISIDDILEDYKIWNIDWFENNKLDANQSRLIVSKIINRGLAVSKTNADGHFFCSDDLVIPVATAIIILTIFKNMNDITNSESRLMQFGTKHGYPSKDTISRFFKDLNLKNFAFKSKKMNATLITLLYNLKSENTKSDRAIKLSQTLRAHKNLNSTLHYLSLDSGYLDVLSRQLCNRGEFGYVYSILANKVYPEKCLSLVDTTNQIVNIKKHFGSIFNVELFAGFANGFEKIRLDILNNILDSSYEETVYMLNKIQLGQLSSKEFDIQCFFGKDSCKFRHSCKFCPYSIPSVYSLKDICGELLTLLKEYHSNPAIGEQIKLSVKINHQLQLISECAQLYGLDFVYHTLSMSQDEFENELLKIDEPEDLFDESNLLI